MNAHFTSGARQTVIITGGNQGLGYACAEALACSDQNWCVVIAGHERDRIAAAAGKLRQSSKAQVEPMLLNLASQRSIRYFSENLSEKLRDGCLPPVRALVCNAAVQVTAGIQYTADGYEQTFGVNHLGHFLLVNLLLPQISSPGRILIVGDGTPRTRNFAGLLNRPVLPEARRLAWPESPSGLHMNGLRRYRTSKWCNLLFASELHRRLNESSAVHAGIDVNLYDPSTTPGTQLIRSWPSTLQRIWQSKTLHSVARCFGAKISTVERTGRSMAGLIMNPELRGVSGKYFQGFNEKNPQDLVCDASLARKLWEDSTDLVRWNKPAEVYVDPSAFVYSEAVHLM